MGHEDDRDDWKLTEGEKEIHPFFRQSRTLLDPLSIFPVFVIFKQFLNLYPKLFLRVCVFVTAKPTSFFFSVIPVTVGGVVSATGNS